MPESATPQRSPSRSTFTVDIGAALRARLNAAAAASGRSPSQFTRELLTRSLAHPGGQRQPSIAEDAASLPNTGPVPTSPAGVGRRIELDHDLAAQLDAYKERGGFRSRPAAIRFALETATQYRKAAAAPAASAPAAEAAPATEGFEPLDPAWLKDATQVLIQSNSALQPIGNNLNQIARSLNAMPGLLNANDAKAIADAQKQIRAHVEEAARLVYSLRTYITPFAGR